MAVEEARTIGARARRIRRRRGLSLEVVAGLAGITAQYLSMLERGLRGFNRRGLLEDLAAALSCAVADLTGQPYFLPDRQSADVAAAVAAISMALHDTTLDDVPDLSVGPLSELAAATAQAHAHADEARYGLAGQGLADLLIALHVRVVTGDPAERRDALARLAQACKVAYRLTITTGKIELAGIAAQRGLDAARLAERPDLVGMLEMNRASALLGIGARRRAAVLCGETLREISALPGPTPDDTRVAEACGMLHLTTALIAARERRAGDVRSACAVGREHVGHAAAGGLGVVEACDAYALRCGGENSGIDLGCGNVAGRRFRHGDPGAPVGRLREAQSCEGLSLDLEHQARAGTFADRMRRGLTDHTHAAGDIR